MNEQGLAPATDDDGLMHREHLLRQQRIRLVPKAIQRKGQSTYAFRGHACTPAVGIRGVEVAAAGKAQFTPSARETMCRGKTRRRRATKNQPEHFRTVEAAVVGNATQKGKITTASRGNARCEQIRLARNHHREHQESNARRIEQQKREDAANQQCQKTTVLKVWRALARATEIAHLQKVKAERHYQYCVMHHTWINLIHNVTCSRAHKTEQVERLFILLDTREAWRRWKHHHYGLLNASHMVREERETSLLYKHFSIWIHAWLIRQRQSTAVEHVATTSGQRARKSRLFRAWKAASETSKQRTRLTEERFQMWQGIKHWLTPAHSL